MPNTFPSCAEVLPGPPSWLSQFFYRNIKVNRVDYAVALDLHPHAVGSRARKRQVELNLGTAVGNERMTVHHVDQVIAGGKHVAPRPEVLLKSLTCVERKTELRVLAGDRLRRHGGEFNLQVLTFFLRVIAL